MDFGQSLEACRGMYGAEKAREQHAEEGDDVDVVLQLPDGTQHQHKFKLGTTVAYVKLQVEQAYGVPMAKQKLTCVGKTMIDPLSLADCPGVTPDASCLVVVSETGEQ